MKHIIMLVILFSGIIVKSQTNYYRYDSQTGASEKIGYSEPATASQHQYSEYVPQYDLGLYAYGLAKKNAEFENHVKDIQNEINMASQAIYYLTKIDANAGNKLYSSMENYINKLRSTALDYSDYNIYQSVMMTFVNYKQLADSLYNDRIHQTNYSSQPISSHKEVKEEAGETITGIVSVYTCSPIVEEPSDDAKVLFRACKDEKVTLLYKVNNYCYRVSCGNIKGYLMRNFIKQ